jgi:hypothetical protein
MPLSKVRRPTKQNCRANMSRNIKLLIDEGKPQRQAVAIAYKMAREGGCRMPDTRGSKRASAKRASTTKRASSRRSARGMSYGSDATAMKVAKYASILRWSDPFARSIVQVHESPRGDLVSTVSTVPSGGRTAYKIRLFDLGTRREDTDVYFQTENLSEASSQAKAYAHSSGQSYGRARSKSARGAGSTRGSRGVRGVRGMAVGFEWPPLDPEFWRRKKGIDLKAAVARAKQETARKASEKARAAALERQRRAEMEAREAARVLMEGVPSTHRKIRSDDVPPTLRQVPETQRRIARRTGQAFGKTRVAVFEYDADRHGRVVNVNAAGEILVGKRVGGPRKKVGKIKRKPGHNYFGSQGRVYEVRARSTKLATSRARRGGR